MTYVTTRIAKVKGFVVAFRALIHRNGQGPEINDPIHVRDIVQYSEQFLAKALYKHTKNYFSGKPKNPSSQVERGAKVQENSKRSLDPKRSAKVLERDPIQDPKRSKRSAKVLERNATQDPKRSRGKNMININLVTHPCDHHFCNYCHTPQSSPSPMDINFCLLTSFSDEDEKLTYKKVLQGEHKEQWKMAIQREVNALEKKSCWEISPIPPHANQVRSFFVFKIKKDEHGNISKFKARLVAKGNSQIQGVHFTESYSPHSDVFWPSQQLKA